MGTKMNKRYFEGGSNLTLGQRSNFDLTLSEILMNMGGESARSLYVSKSGVDDGDGSPGMPFNSIQDAIDAAAELVPAPDYNNPVMVHVGPGVYDENVIHDIDGIHVIGSGRQVTKISPTTGPGYRITNATRESLEVYNVSGDYADLVNAGAVPSVGSVQQFNIASEFGKDALQIIGVKGDASPTTTNFGNWGIYVYSCSIGSGGGGGRGLYMRNVNIPMFWYVFWAGPWEQINCSYPAFEFCDMGGWGDITYDADDPNGHPSYGMAQHWYIACPHCDVRFHGSQLVYADGSTFYDIVMDGTSILRAMNCWFDDQDYNDTATVTMYGGHVRGNLNMEGGVTAYLNGVTVLGATTAEAGAGVVTAKGCHFIGAVTDSSNKIIYDSGHFNDTRHIYVSKQGFAHGDGSQEAPLNTIQAAVDMAAALSPVPDSNNPTVVHVGPGVFTENVVIRCDGLFVVGVGYDHTKIKPTTGVPVVVTNATLASLTTYHASGVYSDLIYDPTLAGSGRGPASLRVENLCCNSPTATDNALELLGVEGDAGAGLTNFLNLGAYVMNSRLLGSGVGTGKSVYARNVCACVLENVVPGGFGDSPLHFYNVSYPIVRFSNILEVAAYYNAADPDGAPTYGLGVLDLYYTRVSDTVTITGSAVARIHEVRSSHGMYLENTSAVTIRGGMWDGAIDCDDSSVLTLVGVVLGSTLNLEGGVTATLNGVTVLGATTAEAGAGVVTESDCTFAGLITDASDKLIHAGEERRGTYTEASGTGSRAITFSPAFPVSSTIQVQLTFEDTGAGYQTAMIASGGVTNTGFTLVTGGNGKFHWVAKKSK